MLTCARLLTCFICYSPISLSLNLNLYDRVFLLKKFNSTIKIEWLFLAAYHARSSTMPSSTSKPDTTVPDLKDLTIENITENVHRINSQCADPRLKYIIERLVAHLHDFARETRLGFDEWMVGIKFLTEVGQICTDVRQVRKKTPPSKSSQREEVTKTNTNAPRVSRSTFSSPTFSASPSSSTPSTTPNRRTQPKAPSSGPSTRTTPKQG